MKIKKRFLLKCECQKEIIGFSQHHVEQNMILHKLTSKEHKERMELFKKFSDIIITKGMNTDQIVNVLSNNQNIINDIKCIGSNR